MAKLKSLPGRKVKDDQRAALISNRGVCIGWISMVTYGAFQSMGLSPMECVLTRTSVSCCNFGTG